MAGTDVFQLGDLLQLQIFQQEPGRMPDNCAGSPLARWRHSQSYDKFIPELFQTHKKTPFPSWRTTKEKGEKFLDMAYRTKSGLFVVEQDKLRPTNQAIFNDSCVD